MVSNKPYAFICIYIIGRKVYAVRIHYRYRMNACIIGYLVPGLEGLFVRLTRVIERSDTRIVNPA